MDYYRIGYIGKQSSVGATSCDVEIIHRESPLRRRHYILEMALFRKIV